MMKCYILSLQLVCKSCLSQHSTFTRILIITTQAPIFELGQTGEALELSLLVVSWHARHVVWEEKWSDILRSECEHALCLSIV